MRIVSFVNLLCLGGTEKAACRWASGLRERGHEVVVLTLGDGPRHEELKKIGISVRISEPVAPRVAAALREIAPDAIHAHAPGHPHQGDLLGEALATLPKKIPVVQTNIFGHLDNPKEDGWTDFRLFISWTSCVQAARRAGLPLDEAFFKRASVAVYPVDPEEPAAAEAVNAFRQRLGVTPSDVLFGRLSRPDPNKWTDLALTAFRIAAQRNRAIKLLLREPPAAVVEKLRASPDADRFVLLPATSNANELRLTMSALDVVLHTSSIGESFGYGIAEPMNLGKPIITHSVPWHDQAQIELVRQGEGGSVASTPTAMARAILDLADYATSRHRMGEAARRHIRTLADPAASIARVESTLQTVMSRGDNPFLVEDLRLARKAAAYLDAHQFGHSLGEQLTLRLKYWRACFHKSRLAGRAREVSKANSPRR